MVRCWSSPFDYYGIKLEHALRIAIVSRLSVWLLKRGKMARCKGCKGKVSFGTKLCPSCIEVAKRILERRASQDAFYWEFINTFRPEALQNFGRTQLNYFVLVTKYSHEGLPIGTSGPCVAVSNVGMSIFNGERGTWDFVGPNDEITLSALADHENLGLVQLGPEILRYLEENNSFIGMPPEAIQLAIDQGLALRIRD